MEKVKFSNDQIYEIKTNGVASDDTRIRIGIIGSGLSLEEIENLVTVKDNVKRIELLSESDEVLKIYSGYTVLTSLEKKKDVVISVTTEEVISEETTGESTEENTEETVPEFITITNRGDVIYISLRKANETEERLASLEETVDVLVMSSLV